MSECKSAKGSGTGLAIRRVNAGLGALLLRDRGGTARCQGYNLYFLQRQLVPPIFPLPTREHYKGKV